MVSEDPKQTVKRLIGENAVKGKQLVNRGREIAEQAQYIVDLANQSEEVLRYGASSGLDYKPVIEAWQYSSEQLDSSLAQTNMSPLVHGLASGSSAASSAMVDYGQKTLYGRQPLPDPEKAAQAVQGLLQVTDRHSKKDHALALMDKFQLSQPVPGKISPTDQLEAAFAAYGGPVTDKIPASTSLLPARDCINQVLDRLLGERPVQEPAGSQRAKVISIGTQLARADVPSTAIESLADNWHALNDQLSASKNKDMTRLDWEATLTRAVLFVIELLETIDPSKLRRGTGT